MRQLLSKGLNDATVMDDESTGQLLDVTYWFANTIELQDGGFETWPPGMGAGQIPPSRLAQFKLAIQLTIGIADLFALAQIVFGNPSSPVFGRVVMHDYELDLFGFERLAKLGELRESLPTVGTT